MILARSAKWAAENGDKKRLYSRGRYAANKSELRANSAAWAKANPLRRIAQFHNREARKRRNGGTFTAAEFTALCERYGNKCLDCGSTDRKLQPDHVIPLSRGGFNGILNIQPLCGPCNFRKHTASTDFRPDGGDADEPKADC